jgi:hypothetical protein
MNVKYLFNDQIYIISNHAVAANPIFRYDYLCERFLEKMEFYLSDLCTIFHYVFDDNQFQIMLRLAPREDFCEYYRKKKGNEALGEHAIPHSSYLFSQAMANLQASMAIHINRTQKRTGALFARRFSKHLITSKDHLNNWFEHMEQLKKHHKYVREWDNKYKEESRSEWGRRVRNMVYWCACLHYKKEGFINSKLSCFKILKTDLEGLFKNLPPLSIPDYQKRKFNFHSLYFTPNST